MELEARKIMHPRNNRTISRPEKAASSPAAHKRSKSALEDKFTREKMDSSQKSCNVPKLGVAKDNAESTKKVALPEATVQTSLKQEIVQLEKHLKDQLAMRGALEKSLGHNPPATQMSTSMSAPKSSHFLTCTNPQPTDKLIKEIAMLEYEVQHLEQHLLSLYRKAFEPHVSNIDQSSISGSRRSLSSQPRSYQETPMAKVVSKADEKMVSSYPQLRMKMKGNQSPELCTEVLADPGINRCQSALSYRAAGSSRIAPSEESLIKALRSCHSQPLAFLEEVQGGAAGVVSLADYLGTNVADHIPETPNNLSEEMLRCMAGIYCKIVDPPLIHQGSSSSPSSSFSSTSAFSPQFVGEIWSPKDKQELTLDTRLINPFCVQGLKEFSGPYNLMVEIASICRNRQKLKDVEALLQTYRLIVLRLETVDLRKMTDDEKLAFWINIHNALLMHAFLKFGIPQNNLKKMSLLVKAECKIAGRRVNAATIQDLILGCHTYNPGMWLRNLLSPKVKGKDGCGWQGFAIQKPEPLLRFALCTGSHSDPAVRLYSPKTLHQQLESAKKDFIRATIGIWKEQKVLLPRVVESYMKDVRITPECLLDMVRRYLPESLRVAMSKRNRGRSSRNIEWVPYNSSFRYLISRELSFPHIT